MAGLASASFSAGRCALVAAAVLALSSIRSDAASFDGSWSVLQVCDATGEGAKGYTWRYDATVREGRLVGHYRNKGQSPSLTLEGKIEQDGSAAFIAEGISGDSDHNLKFAPPQTPIHFRVVAKFDAASGTGKRLGERSCKFTFLRH